MKQSFHRRLAGLASLALLGIVPIGCNVGGGGSGGGGSGGAGNTGVGPANIGAPCVPPDENSPFFAGYKVTEDVIVQGAAECGTGVCLVNHFQGHVTCPLGQATPRDAQGLPGCVPERDAQGNSLVAQGSCSAGDNCIQTGSYSPKCDLSLGQNEADQHCAGFGAGNQCGATGICECTTDADCLFVTDAVVSCDAQKRQCVTYACHEPGDCQQAGATDQENAGKACCLPGTDVPVTKPVCGQCEGHDGHATRDADSAVYCTCRCGVADGEPDEPDYPFCGCPDGFECSEIRKNVGLGDATITGKYCIRQDTAYDANEDQCGFVDGHWASGGSGEGTCAGASSGQCQTSGGPCSD